MKVVGFTSENNKVVLRESRLLLAGDAPLRRKPHAHLRNLKYSCAVGGTHIRFHGGAQNLTPPIPVLAGRADPREGHILPFG